MKEAMADRLARLLSHYGVDVMFSQSLPSRLVLAAEDIGVRQVSYRTENAGGAMADGFARKSGRIGVVCAQNGPAATLLVPPLAEALKASIPILALVQEVPRQQTDKNAFQEFDHLSLFAPCTKWARIVNDPARIDDHLRQALIAATSGRPGPVALMLPSDALLEAHGFGALPGDADLGHYPLDRTLPVPERIDEAARLIADADLPVVIAGGGVHGSQATAALARLQQDASLPVGTTMMGKGAVDETHPLSLGLVGDAMGQRSVGSETKGLIADADVILLVGTRTNQNGTGGWSVLPNAARIIHIDIDGQEIGRNYSALRLAGDVRSTVEHLADALAHLDGSKRQAGRAALEQRITACRQRAQAACKPISATSTSPIRPERLLRELTPLLTPETTIVADASYASVWMATQLTALRPGMRFLSPRGLAGLGWGYPMALGAKIAAREAPVICLSGDGGFGHVWAELETAVRENIKVVLLVLNNGVLGYQKHAETVKFQRHTGACHLSDVDHSEIAAACGCASSRVENPRELQAALRSALSHDGPSLVDVLCDPAAYPPLTMFDGFEDHASTPPQTAMRLQPS